MANDLDSQFEFYSLTQQTSDIQDKVSQLYVAILGRAPDKVGFDGWCHQLANGTEIAEIDHAFGTTSEVHTRYGGLTSGQQIEQLYQNAFNRSADTEGKKYFGSLIDSGVSISDVARVLASAAFTGGGGVDAADTAVIRSKVALGTDFALNTETSDIATAKAAIHVDTHDSVSPAPVLSMPLQSVTPALPAVAATAASGTPDVIRLDSVLGTSGSPVADASGVGATSLAASGAIDIPVPDVIA